MAICLTHTFLRRGLAALIAGVILAVMWGQPALAQVAGTSASVVLATEDAIAIDGQLDDWANIPATVTVGGPQPSTDPGTNGRLRWQVAADPTTIFFAATITDTAIIAGQNGESYWNEDSFEFYLNLSGEVAATSYGPGISQIRISAVDIGGTDPTALTLTGIGLEQHEVTGFVFATDEGWGTEFAVDIAGLYQPAEGERFGLQVQANGSSGGDRDLKLSWSAADTADTSFEDPSVFAQGVFVNALTTESGAATDAPASVVAVPEPAVAGGVQEVESIAANGPEIITADEQRRSLFIAAVVSSIAVFFGGLWFERKRRADEKRHAEKRRAAANEMGLPPAAAEVGAVPESIALSEIDEEEFKALLGSILDDDAPTDGYEER